MNDIIENTLEVLRGKITGNPLISVWRHFPEADLNPKTLTKATVRDYKLHPSNLIKLSPHGRFCVADFGCEIIPGLTGRGKSGSSHCKDTVIDTPQKWAEIEYVDPNDGHLGMQLEFIRLMKQELPEVPKMMTLFSPTMIGNFLSGNQLLDHLRDSDYKPIIEDALKVISRVMEEYSSACIDAGAEGLFTAVQELDKTRVHQSQLKDVISLNSRFMDTAKRRAEFTVLHLHGEDVAFKMGIHAFKPTAVNWHDRTAGPSLEEAANIFPGGLLGGLEPHEVLEGKQKQSVEEAKKLRDRIPMILAPGCVLWQGTPNRIIDDIFAQYRS